MPKLHFETLYAQAVFCNTDMMQAAGGKSNFAGEYYPWIYVLRFFSPPLWYLFTLERYRLTSQFLVRNFDEIPDPDQSPGLLVPALLPSFIPPKRKSWL